MKPLFLLIAPRQQVLGLLLALLPLANAHAQAGPAIAAPAPLADDGGPRHEAAPVVHYYNLVRFQDLQDQLMYDEVINTLSPDLNKRNATDRGVGRKLNRSLHPVTRNLVRA